MKKMLIMLSAVLLLTGGCCGECKADELVNYVPAGMDGIVSMDAARMIKLSHLEDLRKENPQFQSGWNEFEGELKEYGLTPNDLPSRVVVFFKNEVASQNAGVLALTSITEAELLKILNASKDKLSYKTRTIGGRKAYILEKKGEDDTIVLSYIKPNLVLACDEDKAEEFCKVVGKTKNRKLIAASKKADPKALMYLLFMNSKAGKAPAVSQNPDPMGANPLDTLKTAVITLDLVGKEQKDISLKADLECIDEQNAVQLATQLKAFVMIASIQLGQNPELNKAVTEAIRIERKARDVKVDISVSEKLLGQLKDTAKERQAKAEAVRAAAAKAALDKKTAAPEKAPLEKK